MLGETILAAAMLKFEFFLKKRTLKIRSENHQIVRNLPTIDQYKLNLYEYYSLLNITTKKYEQINSLHR